MAARRIRIRTRLRDDIVQVRAILSHVMETGFRIDPKSNDIIPANFIKKVEVFHNDLLVMECDWSRAVAKNPYIEFYLSDTKVGDEISISWVDNLHNSARETIKIN